VDLKEGEEKGAAMDPNLLVSTAAALLETVKLQPEGTELLNRLVSYSYEHREDLGATSRALLAISLHQLERAEEAGIVCENLTDQALLDRENGTCRFGRTAGYYFWFNDAVEATGETLRAYLRVKPKSELIPQMVKWLVANRHGGHWKSTKDTAHAVLALCEYLKVSEELSPDLTVLITVDDGPAKTVRFTKDNVFTADNLLTIRGADLSSGEHVVRVVAKGKGNLYFTGHLTVVTREEDVKGAGNEIFVKRKAYRIHRRKRDVVKKDWVRDHFEERTVTEVYDEKEPLENGATVTTGDEIEIELTLTAKND
jgi:alpha-2-macroglobulin